MALDFQATALALWELFDRGGPRPEYVLPMLWMESRFEPSARNGAGAPYYGLNQASADKIAAAGASVDDYLTWSASAQIARVVAPLLLELTRQYGPLDSATRVLQANWLPATLRTARAPGDAIAVYPAAFYTANEALDANHDRSVTVADLATVARRSVAAPEVQAAIRQTYAARPWMAPAPDPVWGSGGRGARASLDGLGWLALAGALVWARRSVRF